jgi:uncharacterized protein
MTPEERDLVTQLFDRLAALEDAQRDPEAERLVRDGLRQAPNAPYALVQTVLVQDEALKRADARIRELEGGAEAPRRDTSFLGSMRDSLLGRQETRGSVPSVRPSEADMSPAWQRTGAPPGPEPAAAPIGPGGSFLGTAAATAAGVVGGALLLNSIRSMMGHAGGAHAAFDPSGSVLGGGSAAGGELSREAGLDDIGRGPASGEQGRSRGFGLLNDDPADRAEDDDTDDVDESDFDDDGGVSEE